VSCIIGYRVTSVSALLLFLKLWLPRFYFGTGNRW